MCQIHKLPYTFLSKRPISEVTRTEALMREIFYSSAIARGNAGCEYEVSTRFDQISAAVYL
jgi:hypothetical protein